MTDNYKLILVSACILSTSIALVGKFSETTTQINDLDRKLYVLHNSLVGYSDEVESLDVRVGEVIGELQISQSHIDNLTDLIPSPPPPGSENDPDYEAEIVQLPDGSIGIEQAPAFKTVTLTGKQITAVAEHIVIDLDALDDGGPPIPHDEKVRLLESIIRGGK